MCVICSARGLEAYSVDAGNTSALGSEEPVAATWAGSGATGNPYIDGLLSGHRWSGAITYSFPTTATAYQAGITEATNGFTAASFAQVQAARHILEGTSSATGGPRMTMTAFEQFTNASVTDLGSGTSDIRIATSASANPTAYAYYPSTDPRGGDIWFGTSHNYTNPPVGSYEYATMIHELGHALGLKHGHQTGGVSNVAVPHDRDSMEFTVMTYRSYIGQAPNGYTNETFGYAQTFMMLDIAALQQMYGANYSTNGGSSVYTWSPTTGEAFVNGVGQGAPGANRIFQTIWDGGGVDTYDLSNYATNLRIDLSPGGWSTFSPVQLGNLGAGNTARANIFNALLFNGDPRSLIENAIGGSGADTISGNQAANILEGRTGDDVLTGLGGDDMLDGGAGIDTAVYNFTRALATVSSQHGSIILTGPEGADRLTSIEQIRFSDGTFDVTSLLTNATLITSPLTLVNVSFDSGRVTISAPSGTHQVIGDSRLQFADGLVERSDANPLVDDLFYFVRNADVWIANKDFSMPEAHYSGWGWREGRNPNAFFSTGSYLSANDDVRAVGMNPLQHYGESGWREGRDASVAFDTDLYLRFNPDVAAAGVNPLAHYLAHGMAEGRQAHVAVGRQITNGFDREYYLLANPDVGRSGADPLQHFAQFGWREGRKPNAFFDTAGYLAQNADVAAAGVNPLQHYMDFGWREGRDPSTDFDTSLYLARYGDVAAAGVNPFQHYLANGVYEGRSSFGDGLWA